MLTVAILAQGTSWAVAVTQAFLHGRLARDAFASVRFSSAGSARLCRPGNCIHAFFGANRRPTSAAARDQAASREVLP
jgi:hypothetical protein